VRRASRGLGEHWGQGTRNECIGEKLTSSPRLQAVVTGGEARNGKPLEEAWLQVKSEEGNIDGTV